MSLSFASRHVWRHRRQCWVGLAFVVASALSSGCASVTIYQPQKAIHRPVVIQPSPRNFVGLQILVRCNSHEDFLPPEDANKLCTGLVEDLRRQGATAESVVPIGTTFIEPEVFDGSPADLTVEIESRIDHEYEYTFSAVASVFTLTMIPSISEQTFSQRVVVFGKDRSILTEEVFVERFVTYSGLGVYGLNYILDWFFRSEEDALSGDAPKEDFTRDFYGQIRQLTFNARVRSEILGLTAAPARSRSVRGRAPVEVESGGVENDGVEGGGVEGGRGGGGSSEGVTTLEKELEKAEASKELELEAPLDLEEPLDLDAPLDLDPVEEVAPESGK